MYFRVLVVALLPMFHYLLALQCSGRTNELTRKCSMLCSETNCPSYCTCNPDKSNNACSPLPFIPNNTITIQETTAPGTTILSMNSSGYDKWEMALLRSGLVDGSIWNHLSSYFILKKVGNVYEMVVDQQPDLEAIFDHYAIKLRRLTISLMCKLSAHSNKDIKTHQITLEILPVNEFPPEFSESVLMQNVTEDSKVGSVVYMLINHTVDMDVNPLGKELGFFGLSDYLKDLKHDGKEFFEMQDFSLGNIVLKQSLDFEALQSLNATQFFLNLSASDVHNWTTYTTLTINIVDVDDLPPEFYHPGCPAVSNKSRPCLVSYEAILPLNHVGFLTDIVPSFIRARDMDSLNSPVEYSLDLAPGETRANSLHFVINKTTGQVLVTAPFHQKTEINLVVVASEITAPSKTTQASLHVIVDDKSLEFLPLKYEDLSTSPNTIHTLRKESTFGLVFIVTSSTTILCLLLLVVVLCVKLNKLNRSMNSVGPVDSQKHVDPKVPPENIEPLTTSQTLNQNRAEENATNINGNQSPLKQIESMEDSEHLMSSLYGQQLGAPMDKLCVQRVDGTVSLENRNKSCFNDNESSTAIVTYYFNGRKSSEFQKQNIFSAQYVVPVERNELWDRQIVSRDYNGGVYDNFSMNKTNIVLDMDMHSTESMRRFSQHIKREHAINRQCESVGSESSNSLCSKSEIVSPERQREESSTSVSCQSCASPYDGDFNNTQTPSPKSDYSPESCTRCISGGTEAVTIESCSEQIGLRMSRSLYPNIEHLNNRTDHSDRKSANILSILPLDQQSFICVTDDNCDGATHRSDSSYNKSDPHQRNVDSDLQIPNSCQKQYDSPKQNTEQFEQMNDLNIKKRYAFHERINSSHRRQESFHQSNVSNAQRSDSNKERLSSSHQRTESFDQSNVSNAQRSDSNKERLSSSHQRTKSFDQSNVSNPQRSDSKKDKFSSHQRLESLHKKHDSSHRRTISSSQKPDTFTPIRDSTIHSREPVNQRSNFSHKRFTSLGQRRTSSAQQRSRSYHRLRSYSFHQRPDSLSQHHDLDLQRHLSLYHHDAPSSSQKPHSSYKKHNFSPQRQKFSRQRTGSSRAHLNNQRQSTQNRNYGNGHNEETTYVQRNSSTTSDIYHFDGCGNNSKNVIMQVLPSSFQKETRPNTCPNEMLAAESSIIHLPHRPWTSENRIDAEAFNRSLLSLNNAGAPPVQFDASVTQKGHIPMRSPYAAVAVSKDIKKRTSTSVSFNNLKSLTSIHSRPPRHVGTVKKKRRRNNPPSSDSLLSRIALSSGEVGDCADGRAGVAQDVKCLHIYETDHHVQQLVERHPYGSEMRPNPRARRLPALQQRPLRDFPFENALNMKRLDPSTSIQYDIKNLKSEQLMTEDKKSPSKTGTNATGQDMV